MDELTNKHISLIDQKNLAIISKTVSALQIQDCGGFWEAVNRRFIQIEHQLDLHNFAFIVYGFVSSGILDEEGFLRSSTKALLRNINYINWKDFSMLLTVAMKLKFTREEPSYDRFLVILTECAEQLIGSPQTAKPACFTIVLFALHEFCRPKCDYARLLLSFDNSILSQPALQKELINNHQSLFKLVQLITSDSSFMPSPELSLLLLELAWQVVSQSQSEVFLIPNILAALHLVPCCVNSLHL